MAGLEEGMSEKVTDLAGTGAGSCNRVGFCVVMVEGGDDVAGGTWDFGGCEIDGLVGFLVFLLVRLVVLE